MRTKRSRRQGRFGNAYLLHMLVSLLLPTCALNNPVGQCNLLYPTLPGCADSNKDCHLPVLYGCDCLVVTNETRTARRRMERNMRWEHMQAVVQLSLSLTSLLLGTAYMSCFALWPKKMWRFPLSLAFWIYVCDFLVSLQFVVMSILRLKYVLPGDDVLTSNAACLCDIGTVRGAYHPGCACNNGFLAFLAQSGVVGSVAFYTALAHNFYCSVRDPFTRPRSRLALYHFFCWSGTLLLSVPYLIPADSAWTGFGYRASYLMCWSPERQGQAFTVANLQNFFTVLVPIVPSVLVAPALYFRGMYIVRQGGAPLKQALSLRDQQLHQARVVLSFFTAYWSATGVSYILGSVLGFASWTNSCDPTDFFIEDESDSHSFGCVAYHLSQATFSGLLCFGGSVNALAGFSANGSKIRDGLRELRRRLAARRRTSRWWDEAAATLRSARNSRTTDGSHTLTELEPPRRQGAEEDISAYLRQEVVEYALRGITRTSAAGAKAAAPGDVVAASSVTTSRETARVPSPTITANSRSAAVGNASALTLAEAFRRTHLPRPAPSPSDSGVQLPPGEAFHEVLLLHLSSTTSFREYAPRVWQWVRREVYHTSVDEYTESMSAGGTAQELKFSEAKGGGFFFFSSDKRYIVKTLDGEEHRTLLQLLPAYCRHMREHPNTLLLRISGCYAITMYEQTKYFYVMDNLFSTAPPMSCPQIDECFDLKGSWIDRHASMREKAAKKVLKDSDWAPGRRLQVSEESRAQLLRQAQLDARFLSAMRIMDYSLLLGIHHIVGNRVWLPTASSNNLSTSGPFSESVQASFGSAISPRELGATIEAEAAQRCGPLAFSAVRMQGPGEYRLGIIDPLQRWNWRKRMERFAKLVFYCRCASQQRNGMSAVAPREYARRFHLMVGTKLLGYTTEEVKEDWEAVSAQLDKSQSKGPSAASDGNSEPE